MTTSTDDDDDAAHKTSCNLLHSPMTPSDASRIGDLLDADDDIFSESLFHSCMSATALFSSDVDPNDDNVVKDDDDVNADE